MNYQLIAFIIFILACAFAVGKKSWREAAVKDFTMLLSKEGRAEIRKQHHDEHFYVSAAIAAGCVLVGYWISFIQLSTFDHLEVALAFWVAGFFGNLFREGGLQWYNGQYPDKTWKVPFDMRDVRFGAWGAMWGGLIAFSIIVALVN